jgi:hypothetical protein
MTPLHIAVYFGDEVWQTIYLGWPGTMVLQMLASQVSRVIGINPDIWFSSLA